MQPIGSADIANAFHAVQVLLNAMWSNTYMPIEIKDFEYDHVGTSYRPLPEPFRVIWNYPDQACKKMNISFNLPAYGIESNQNTFIEDTIALFYAQRFGAWPYIDVTKDRKWVNGGLPQYTNMSAHLRALHSGITSYRHGGASGFGVLNMELWRPIFRTNWGRFAAYVPITIDHVVKKYPGLPKSLHRQIAQQIWEVGARYLMSSSLSVAKAARPSEKWGFYRYPELSTRRQNDQLQWLWKSVTAYYPSIYIKTFKRTHNETEAFIINQIAEAFRVRALYGNPDDPIMAYTVVQSVSLGKFRGKWLQLAIQLPIELGVDGLVLWASSKEFSHPTDVKCRKQKLYVNKILGPKVKALLARMRRCSAQLCAGHGRCVNRKYAERVKYVRDRGARTPEVPAGSHQARPPTSGGHVNQALVDKYVCQCYPGWAGEWCGYEY